MQRPTLKFEKKLWRQGKKVVVGLDEVGIGALAGPVVAAAVSFKRGFRSKNKLFKLVRDSKSLNEKQRERLFAVMAGHPQVRFAVARVWPTVIDRINIRQAALLAMRRALKRVGSKPQFVLLDGAAILKNYPAGQRAIVKGDKKIFSIAAASIFAKVTRDRIMKRMSKKFPNYLFEVHKGYGTKAHRRLIRKHGPSDLHRLSFCQNPAPH